MICSVVFKDLAMDLIDYFYTGKYMSCPFTLIYGPLKLNFLVVTDKEETGRSPTASLNSSMEGT